MISTLKQGMPLEALRITPTRTQLFSFSAITWNRHKIHFDQAQARLEGFPDVVVQRGLLGNFLARFVTERAGPGARLERLQWKVLRSAFPEQEIACTGEVIEVSEIGGAKAAVCSLKITNHDGQEIAVGEAGVRFTP